MSTLLTILPLDEVKELLQDYFKCVQKVAIMTGDYIGIAVEYYDDRDKKVHVRVIRPMPVAENTDKRGYFVRIDDDTVIWRDDPEGKWRIINPPKPENSKNMSKMEELEINETFINHTQGYEEAPFEIVMADKYMGNQQLTNAEAKSIADFIYKKLGLNNEHVS